MDGRAEDVAFVLNDFARVQVGRGTVGLGPAACRVNAALTQRRRRHLNSTPAAAAASILQTRSPTPSPAEARHALLIARSDGADAVRDTTAANRRSAADSGAMAVAAARASRQRVRDDKAAL
jgi:hypothetical protein